MFKSKSYWVLCIRATIIPVRCYHKTVHRCAVVVFNLHHVWINIDVRTGCMVLNWSAMVLHKSVMYVHTGVMALKLKNDTMLLKWELDKGVMVLKWVLYKHNNLRTLILKILC